MALKVVEYISLFLSLLFGEYLKDLTMSILRMFSFGSISEPETKLDPASIKLIRESWSEVEKGDLQETGLVVFRRLFEIAPYLRDLFPFGYNPDGKDLKAHALGVMSTVGVAVRGLDDLESLKPKLVELGALHKGFEITDKEFKHVGEAIIWTLDKGLGDQFTPEVKAAWVEAYGLITTTMKEGLK
ncbi:neuroglobin-like isoform X2 [Actinia tenebrosa]|uniref:Neuroglobin-like isoform X2 n=1 Tax=Actinia tenebrosa TaxID=6105 RepID=A0A6P8HKK1_ACTTE|nr:neuroglobin-like isoform X2 [Actinia tenebrosa]